MLIGDLMTRDVLTAREDETLMTAMRRMLSQRLDGLPVVDGEGRLKGLLEIDDLLPKLEPVPFSELAALKLFDEWVDENNLEGFYQQYQKMSVAKMMRPNVDVLSPEDSLSKALHLMARSGARLLPVVGEEQRLVGVLTRSDILRTLTRTERERGV